MSLFKRLAAQGKIKQKPKTTTDKCDRCGGLLKDFEALEGTVCARCKIKEVLKPLTDSGLFGHLEIVMPEDEINNPEFNDLPF